MVQMNHEKLVRLFHTSGLTVADFKNEKVGVMFMSDEGGPVVVKQHMSKDAGLHEFESLIIYPPGTEHYGWEGEDEWDAMMADLAKLTGEDIHDMDMTLCA